MKTPALNKQAAMSKTRESNHQMAASARRRAVTKVRTLLFSSMEATSRPNTGNMHNNIMMTLCF